MRYQYLPLLAIVTTGSLGVAQGASTLARALEYHRQGNCSDAKPLLEHLLAQEPENKTIKRLLTTCTAKQESSEKASLRQARTAALAPRDAPPPKPGAKKAVARKREAKVAPAPTPTPGTPSALRVAGAVLTREDPRKIIHPNPPAVEARVVARTAPAAKTVTRKPRPAVARKSAPKPANTPPVLEAAKVVPPLPIGIETVPLPAEFHEREKAGSQLYSAEKLIKAKQLDEAQQILLQLSGAKPDLTLPHQRLAEIYSAQGKFVEAATEYGWLADHNTYAEFRLRQAQNYSWAKRYDEAAVSYRQYLQRHGNDAGARLGLAQVLFWSDHLPEAIQAYESYLELKPGDAESRLNLGRAQLWTGKADEAYENLTKAKEKLPRDLFVELLIAKSLEMSAKPEKAVAAYEVALTADPNNKEAREGLDRVTGLVLLKAGYSKQEKNDFSGAIQAFTQYLGRNPSDEKVLLQVGRLHGWAQEAKEAVRYYDLYLQRQPDDLTALRELGKVQLTIPDLAGARKTYATLVSSNKPTIPDYEGLVSAHVWDSQFDSAQPFVKKLLDLDPGNAIAKRASAAIHDTQRMQQLEAAQRLTSAGKYKEALEAYRTFTADFGATWEVELTTARLYGWNKQTPKAVQSYQEYLSRYPKDSTARLELADLERWSGKLNEAQTEYAMILHQEPKNTQALFGSAQVADQKGADRFGVLSAYRMVLNQDPGHQLARQRVAEIMPSVSPSVQFRMNNFHDSDDFGRQVSTVEVGIPFHGGLKLSPLFRHAYFNQFRQVGGGFCGGESLVAQSAEVESLSSDICSKRGNVHGFGGGLRFDLTPNPKLSLTGEVAAVKLNTILPRWSMNGNAELVVHPKADRSLIFGVMHRDALYDVNTIGSLFAGIMQDAAQVSYEQPLSDRWRIWLSGGLARYTGGLQKTFDPNNQKRLSGRVDYHVLPWMTAGYYVRLTGFSQFSPLYFSPEFYGTTGFRYFWEKPLVQGLRTIGEMEIGYGRINRYDMAGVNTAEFSLHAGIAWDIRPDLTLKLGYRFGRGRSSSFGSPVYSTGMLDMGMSNYWMPPMPAVNPSRIEIR